MMTLTVKAKKLKVFGICVGIVCAIVVVGTIIMTKGNEPYVNTQYVLNDNTNDFRIAFLNSFGWETSVEPVEVKDVLIPKEFSDVYKSYNELQISQGLDLSKYKSKVVKAYRYEILNYPLEDKSLEGTIFANLLVYENEIIGGDVCSVSTNGFMHGFELPK